MNFITLLQQSLKIRSNNLTSIGKLCGGSSGRCSSTFTKDGREEAVVLSEDARIMVCWHPEPSVPYECTRPLPQEPVNASALKFKFDSDAKDTFRKTHPFFERKKFEAMTSTYKLDFFQLREDKLQKFKEKMPKDREYL